MKKFSRVLSSVFLCSLLFCIFASNAFTEITLVTLQAWSTGDYVEGNMGSLNANSNGVGTPEIFELRYQGDGTVALFAHHTLHYVCAEAGTDRPLVANRSAVGPWEKFRIIDLGNNTIALQSADNNKYVAAELHVSGNPLRANRDTIGAWEKFTISYVVDLWWAVKSFADHYPNSIKKTVGYGEIITAREINVNGELWDYAKMGWDRNNPWYVWTQWGLHYVDDWEVLVTFQTINDEHPHADDGAFWDPAATRARRYSPINVEAASPTGSHDEYNIDSNCNIVGPVVPWTLFGTTYPPFMKNLGGDMGNRWIIQMSYADYETDQEAWFIDLGPSVNTYSPKYGVVGYRLFDNNGTPNDESDDYWYDQFRPIISNDLSGEQTWNQFRCN